MISRTIIPLYLPCGGEGQDEEGRRGAVGADSSAGVCWCVLLVFRISSPRRLRTNPWRLFPYLENTSFRQTDRRSDFSFPPNNCSETEKHNPKKHAKSSREKKTLMFS